jgi:hypothetical protein
MRLGANDARPVIQRIAAQPGAGNVEYQIKRGEFPHHAIDKRDDLIFRGDIAAMRQCASTGGTYARGDVPRQSVIDIGDDDARAHRRAATRDGRTGAGTAARHQRNTPLQLAQRRNGSFRAVTQLRGSPLFRPVPHVVSALSKFCRPPRR